MEETRIAILYICTGQYKVFWNDFYESFQAQFLPKCQKKYFVFTDQGDLCHKENVHIVYIPHQEWPYNTLMRFEFFLKEKKELDPRGGGWLTGDLPLKGTVDSARPLSFLVDSWETCP